MKLRRSTFYTSVVAGLAVVGDCPLLVTVHAEAHRVVHDAFGDAHLGDIAMTCLAFHLRANVRGMVEAHMGFIVPAVDALPGYVFAAIVVGLDFLDLRAVCCSADMTAPTGAHVRDSGHGPSCHGNMAIHALQLHGLDMSFVRKGDRLDCFGSHSEKVAHGHAHGGVRRSEDIGRLLSIRRFREGFCADEPCQYQDGSQRSNTSLQPTRSPSNVVILRQLPKL